MMRPKNIHTRDIIQTENNLYVYIYIYIILRNLGDFEGRKEKGINIWPPPNKKKYFKEENSSHLLKNWKTTAMLFSVNMSWEKECDMHDTYDVSLAIEKGELA